MKNKSVKTKKTLDKAKMRKEKEAERRKDKKIAKEIEERIKVMEDLAKERGKQPESLTEEGRTVRERINKLRMELQKRQEESDRERKEKEAWEKIEKETWEDVRNEVEEIFDKKCKKIGVEAILELELIDRPPHVDEFFVYGEAFPEEHRIWVEIDSPEASTEEITETICHELLHIKSPELDHSSREFKRKVKEYMKD